MEAILIHSVRVLPNAPKNPLPDPQKAQFKYSCFTVGNTINLQSQQKTLLWNLEPPRNLCLKHAGGIVLLAGSLELVHIARTPALEHRLRDVGVVEVEEVEQIIAFLQELLLLVHNIGQDLRDQGVVCLVRVGGRHVDHDVVRLSGLQAEEVRAVGDRVRLNQELHEHALDLRKLGHGLLPDLEELEVRSRVGVAEGEGELEAAGESN